MDYFAGYLAALGCAVVWAAYSVLSRRFKAVPTDTVVVFCLLSAALSLVCHLAFETTQWPQNSSGWLALLAIGLLPTGLAFYVWDVGMKHGDIQALGALSYATPILSTGLLIGAGYARPSLLIGAALLLVTCGAVIASKDMILRRKAAPDHQPDP
jgi:drug/metabolite transporter (DMT)-like permease